MKNMIKKLALLVISVIYISISVQAQKSVGGNVSINIINNVLIIEAAPEISYEIIENTSLGFSPFAIYTQNLNNEASLMLLGARMFSQYRFSAGFFAHAEYEVSSLYNSEGFGKITHALPIGGGYEQALNSNTVAYASILYDVLLKPDYTYRKNPIVRAGVRYNF